MVKRSHPCPVGVIVGKREKPRNNGNICYIEGYKQCSGNLDRGVVKSTWPSQGRVSEELCSGGDLEVVEGREGGRAMS